MKFLIKSHNFYVHLDILGYLNQQDDNKLFKPYNRLQKTPGSPRGDIVTIYETKHFLCILRSKTD